MGQKGNYVLDCVFASSGLFDNMMSMDDMTKPAESALELVPLLCSFANGREALARRTLKVKPQHFPPTTFDPASLGAIDFATSPLEARRYDPKRLFADSALSSDPLVAGVVGRGSLFSKSIATRGIAKNDIRSFCTSAPRGCGRFDWRSAASARADDGPQLSGTSSVVTAFEAPSFGNRYATSALAENYHV